MRSAGGIDAAATVEALEAAVAALDSRSNLLPEQTAELQFERGQLLERLGRTAAASAAYAEVLRSEPAHVGALNALGSVILASGDAGTARILLGAAVVHGPVHAAAHANLARLFLHENELAAARSLYERALVLDPGMACAHFGLADLHARLGDPAASEQHRARGQRSRPITIEPAVGSATKVRVLALGTAQAGNIPTHGYFDRRVFGLAAITVDYWDPELPLPPHDVIFNAIGEAELCGAQLERAATIVERSSAPVINHPAAVARTGRAENARRLGALPGVVTPRMRTFRADALSDSAAASMLVRAGFRFPLLLRSPGFHTGEHFVLVERAADLRDAARTLPGQEILVIEFLDLRDAHGRYRKYRVMIVGGTLYPLHLAISQTWKVHYFSADMAASAAHRGADAAFVADLRGVLAPRTIDALERVRDALGLDYAGIDFAVDAAGNAVIFEANASMVVPLPPSGEAWAYRRAPVARIRKAVREMIAAQARPERRLPAQSAMA